jgi:predicted aspartyl protease
MFRAKTAGMNRAMRRLLLASACIALFATATHAAVPLTRDSTGHVIVPAYVDGKGPYPFILDTGADESAVYAWFAKSLRLAKGESRALSGATGDIEMTSTRLATLGVDGHNVRNVDADTMPDRKDGARIAGVAGVDMMASRLAVLDFGCGTFALLPMQDVTPQIAGAHATLTKAGGIKDGKQFTLPVTLNGVAGIAVLDSGARSTMINNRYAAAAGVHPESAAFKNGDPARGATGAGVATRVGPIGTVRFAGIVRSGVTARVVDLPVFESAGLSGRPTLNLGVDILSGTRLTVDYSARRFWLAESSCKGPARDPAWGGGRPRE